MVQSVHIFTCSLAMTVDAFTAMPWIVSLPSAEGSAATLSGQSDMPKKAIKGTDRPTGVARPRPSTAEGFFT